MYHEEENYSMIKGNDIDVVTNTTYEFLSNKFRMFPTFMSETRES